MWELTHWFIWDYLRIYKRKYLGKDFSIDDYNSFIAENFEKLKNQLISDATIIFEDSKAKNYENYDKNDKFGLYEHYLKQDIDSLFNDKLTKLIWWLELMVKSDQFIEIIKQFDEDHKIFIEDKEPNFDKMKIKIDTIPELLWVTLWAQPDFWIIDKSWNNIVIYDWKTGKIPNRSSEEISDQIRVYSYKTLLNIWIENKNNLNITGLEYYVNDNLLYWWKIQLNDFDKIEAKIIEDVNIMKTFLIDENIENNIPIYLEKFEKTDNQTKCDLCVFKKVCNDLSNYEWISKEFKI